MKQQTVWRLKNRSISRHLCSSKSFYLFIFSKVFHKLNSTHTYAQRLHTTTGIIAYNNLKSDQNKKTKTFREKKYCYTKFFWLFCLICWLSFQTPHHHVICCSSLNFCALIALQKNVLMQNCIRWTDEVSYGNYLSDKALKDPFCCYITKTFMIFFSFLLSSC